MSYKGYLNDLEKRTNPNGKRLTWNQVVEQRQRLAAGERVAELEERDRPGICDGCGSGRFYLKIVDRRLVRVCKGDGCGHEMHV